MEGKIFFYLLHCILRGSASNVDVLGIAEVQELPAFGCIDIPRTLYEVIAQLANRLAQWDDKFWRFFLTKIRTHLIQTFNTSTFRSSAFEHCVHILYKGILLIFLEVLFLTSIIGAADEVKLKFMTRCFLAYWPISYALLKKVSVLPESFLFSGL
ncbi:uncharacterized protein LOC123216992 isoform X2 [Mangifera indica]|uniref:uncharacterized protein LOC123216992 isoform X2 n=1 Tax=Mangifera indica TaxID=29780 RepID=UPI001CFADE73|nr:uncharacterized protein LOC123216992 isoform X2 [Mangifera indica]